jgi:cell division protein FtsI (penicillin-binding protein 3)
VAELPAHNWRNTVKRRLLVSVLLLGGWAVSIEARLVYLQVVRHGYYSEKAQSQQVRTIETAPERGDILDRNGNVLAYSVEVDSIYAVPKEVGDPDVAAGALCRALRDCQAADRKAMADRIRRGRLFAYVRRQVSADQAARVAALELKGVGFLKENRRFYPNKELGAHLLGYVGIDNVGLSGLEATHDSLIRGHSGTMLVQTDARGRPFQRVERPPTSGATLELTMDQTLQHIAERELRAGIEENRAAGGSVVVMAPHTGEILALANWPGFNPNAYSDAPAFRKRNKGVQDLYEPGSTLKIVTASAAIEEGLLGPDDLIDVRPGRIRIGRGRVINDDHAYGVLSFTDVIVKSSNVGAIKAGFKVGPLKLGEYVARFGFGRRTSPDFPAESPGIVWDPAKLTDSALASISMGYQVAVTPLQMAVAVSSIANGGNLPEPRIVRAVIQDDKRTPVPHKVLRRTVSSNTAAILTEIMEQVVERGTGTRARVPGFMVAGKTGTAQKVVDGRYSRSEYNASFVGFVPSRKPEFAIVVVIDSPHGKNSYYGGTVAAPIFQRIADEALRLRGVTPSINPAPPVLVKRDGDASSPRVVKVKLPPADEVTQSPATGVPDLRGLGAREAMKAIARIGMKAQIRGAGVVVDQQPAPGSTIEPGATATLTLQRRITVNAESSSSGGTQQ